jgi:hypothetical protein
MIIKMATLKNEHAVLNILSRINGCVTNNNGLWIGDWIY